MPKTKISEYSTTNSANTDIEGINIDEGCPPSSINNAIRELMVHLKEFQTGASGDAFTFAGGTLMSGTNTISGAAVISGNINSSGTTNTFSGGNILSGTNTISGSAIISGNINSSGTNTFSGSQVISGNINASGTTNTFSGNVVVSSAGALKVNAITDASGGNTATINSMTPTADSLQGFRNRIINGAMVIDQRNAGAAVTPTTAVAYPVDRWATGEDTDGAMTAQRSTVAPTGFINSVVLTTTTADPSLGASQFTQFRQPIEGFNTSDFGWGTASAKTVTLSFWVRSSLTGTFAGSLRNSDGSRSYVFTYTISSANTWEYETITIPGDTTGTWLTDNNVGLYLTFNLGTGTTYQTTAGSWTAGNYWATSGAVSVIGTLNATWYITGVQLEVGSVATPFERRDYGRELMMCQRYCFAVYANDNYTRYGIGECDQSTSTQILIPLPTVMRAVPTINTTGTASNYAIYSAGGVTALNAVPFAQTITATPNCVFLSATVASGLTAGRASQLISNNNTTSYLKFFAEL